MKICGRILLALVAVLLSWQPLFSDEAADLQAIIAKGIKARGSEQDLAKYKAMIMKGTGTFYGLGEGIPYTADWHIQGSKQARFSLEMKNMDQTFTFTKVLNGDKGWMKINNDVKDLDADALAEDKEEAYARYITMLLPLKGKAFQLAAVGEVKVEGKDAVGVRVSHKGHRDVNLYFDKASHLLVKTEHTVKDPQAGNQEMSEETFMSGYKEFKNIKFSTKVTIKRDGKLFVEAAMTEFEPVESIDQAQFGKP
jgi:hypothetical protein